MSAQLKEAAASRKELEPDVRAAVRKVSERLRVRISGAAICADPLHCSEENKSLWLAPVKFKEMSPEAEPAKRGASEGNAVVSAVKSTREYSAATRYEGAVVSCASSEPSSVPP